MKKTFEILKVSILSIALKFIYGTNRKSVVGENNYKELIKKNESIIFSVWHGHLLSIVQDDCLLDLAVAMRRLSAACACPVLHVFISGADGSV